MSTLCLLFSHCGKPLTPPIERCVFNHPFVVSSFIWAIVVLILGILIAYWLFCYLKSRNYLNQAMADAVQKHELDMKKEAFEQEKFWHFQKELKKDYQKELNEKIQKLEEEKKKMEDDLDKEKIDRNETLIKERLQAEHDFYKKIISQFYSTEENHI